MRWLKTIFALWPKKVDFLIYFYLYKHDNIRSTISQFLFTLSKVFNGARWAWWQSAVDHCYWAYCSLFSAEQRGFTRHLIADFHDNPCCPICNKSSPLYTANMMMNIQRRMEGKIVVHPVDSHWSQQSKEAKETARTDLFIPFVMRVDVLWMIENVWYASSWFIWFSFVTKTLF